MTISGAYTQSFSFSLSIATVRVATAPGGEANAVSNQSPAQSGDTVTLSPEATAQPTETATPPSPSAQKADALLAAFDADDDGQITKDEFRDGALALLGRRSGAEEPQSADGESDDRVRGHHHRSHRLERKLEKLFDRVDANDDGAVDVSELTDALARIDARRAKKHACCEALQQPQQPAQQVESSASYASVTVVAVAVAVKQYAAIGAAA